MMRRIISILLLSILLAQIGVQEGLAIPQYLTNLTAVYGSGSCTTCHVDPSGGARNPYGQLFENQSNHKIDPGSALIATGTPPGMNVTAVATSTGTPAATATAAPTQVVTATVTVIKTAVTTPVATTAAPRTPGFGPVVSVAGLLVCFLLLRRRN